MENVESIKSVFERECSSLKIDGVLARKIKMYQVGFVNKNADHIEFFGGNLLGVQPVRFTNADRDRWFDEILQTVESHLESKLIALPTVNKEFHVSSDTMNLSCVWLTHAVYTSPYLDDRQKHDCMIDILLILQYKYFTSLLFRYFRFQADRQTAEATYNALSYKFAIKVYGSWSKLLNARADAIITDHDASTGRPSIHYDTVTRMDNDSDIIYMLNDTQGRIRDTVKNIYGVFITIHQQGQRILVSSSTVEHDGVEILKDKTKNLLAYGRYLQSIVTDRNSFIREELVGVIQNLMHTMPPALFRQTLEWISDNFRIDPGSVIEKVLSETLVHSFDYLNQNRNMVKNTHNLGELMSTLRGVYMSSRSTDETLLKLRSQTEEIVKQATGSKNTTLIASVRTGVLLYLVLRAFTMKHYTSK